MYQCDACIYFRQLEKTQKKKKGDQIFKKNVLIKCGPWLLSLNF